MTNQELWNKLIAYKGLTGKTVGTYAWRKIYEEYCIWEA